MELLSYGRRIRTPYFVNPSRIQCCADNRTDSIRPAGIGYWSSQSAINGEFLYRYNRSRTQGRNFTTKWIYGFPHPKLYYDNETAYGHMIWRDLPRLTALNCKPIIESATARVTVDRADGTVESFQMLENLAPIGRPAWNESYEARGYVEPPQANGQPVIGGLVKYATRYVQTLLMLIHLLTGCPSAMDISSLTPCCMLPTSQHLEASMS